MDLLFSRCFAPRWISWSSSSADHSLDSPSPLYKSYCRWFWLAFKICFVGVLKPKVPVNPRPTPLPFFFAGWISMGRMIFFPSVLPAERNSVRNLFSSQSLTVMMEDDQILQLMERVCVSLPFWLASDLGSLMFFFGYSNSTGGW